ncbi:hypothetical protein ACVLD2_003549 [Paenibacillus sp. PvR052]|uniref:acyl-CoA reductase n=2 Tax=Paenibacillus TaxID=44249 RepID=UPI001AE4A7D9|nr:acyl-CoA reductase [Paenibacillus sp. PvP091]MBP1153332.1 hypothetical protein [Paenibacillus sp. PvP091]MBP1171285.1 hypothetical protein [Paenibacillus sp. PvR098]
MSSMERITVRTAYKVPDAIRLTSFTERHFNGPQGTLVLKYPDLTPELIGDIAREISMRRRDYLSRLRTEQIVERLDLAVRKWLDPDYNLRRLAEAWLPVITGYDGGMIRLELKRFFRTFRRKELLRFLDEEFDASAVLDEFRPRKNGGMSRAYGPELLFHVFSGNVPGLPIWSLVMGILLKSANLGKTSSAEPLMAVLFAETLAEVDPLLADCLAVLPWKGGNEALEQTVIDAAEAIVAYGSQETVEKLRSRVPGTKRFVSYGYKISFAMIGKEALTADRYQETARRLAEDASIYDQQGCLAPHSVFVEEGGAVTPRQFGQLLASEMERYHEKKPRAVLSDEESMAIHAVRQRFEMMGLRGEPIAVYASRTGTDWTVIYHGQPGFEASPLNRTVHVFACESLESAADQIQPYRDYLQTVGLAVGPDRLEPVAGLLGMYGATRICAVGEMSRTPSGWHHDGHLNLLDLVRWVDLERSVEQDAERYDPDVE